MKNTCSDYVIETLRAARSMTILQLALETGYSHRHIRRTLIKLVETGQVHVETDGSTRQTHYSTSATPMIERDKQKLKLKLTGEWITAEIRAGRSFVDLCSLTAQQEAMIRDGHAQIIGDSKNGLYLRVPALMK